MSLKYFKSLTEYENKHKSRNRNNNENLKVFCKEECDAFTCQQSLLASSPQNKVLNSELLREKLPELVNLASEEVVKNNKSNTQKLKTIKLCSQKHKSNDSHLLHETNFELKSENKDKSYPINGERTTQKKNFIVKQIPIKSNLLEFSIDRSHCPMVVRIHRGQPKKSKHKTKQGSGTSQTRSLTHSFPCLPEIHDQLKIASDTATYKHKKKREKSKQTQKYHGYTICELLNLSPRKSGKVPKNNNLGLGIFKDGNTPNKLYTKKILKNKKCKSQSGGVNERICNYVTDNIKYMKEIYSNKRSSKSQKVLVKDKSYEHDTVSAQSELEDDDSSFEMVVHTSDTGPSLDVTAESNEFEKEFIYKQCNGEATQMDKSHLPDLNRHKTMSVMQNNKTGQGKLCLQNHAQGEMPHGIVSCCQICNKNDVKIKNQTNFTLYHAPPYASAPVKDLGNTVYDDSQTYLKLERLSAEKVHLPPNIVTLDASQSQFYKISEFLRENTSKDSQKPSLELYNKIPSSGPNNSLVFSNQECIKNRVSTELTQSGTYGKVKLNRSEDEYLNKYGNMNNYYKQSDNEQSGILRQKYNSSFARINTFAFKTDDKFANEKVKNKSHHSSYYKCLACSKVVCKTENLDAYCSYCKLKNKLSQISNDSMMANSDTELNDSLASSVKALTIIPESDLSLSKHFVSVAIQTDYDLGDDTQNYSKQNIKPDFVENNNPPYYLLENMFKMYCSRGAEFNKIQENSLKTRESLTRINNSRFLYAEDFSSGDIQRQKQVMEQSDNLSEKSYLSSKLDDSRRFNLCRTNSLKPNSSNIRVTETDNYSQKGNFSPNVSIVTEHQTKFLASSFVSPIFPEKEYCRTTCNRQKPYPTLGLTSSNEIFISQCAIHDPLEKECSQKYMHKVHSKSDNNWEPVECFSIQSEILSTRKAVESVAGSYINPGKRSSFYNGINNFKNSPEVKQFEKNNELSLYKRGKSIPGHINMLPDVSFSTRNVKKSSISVDNYLKREVNKSYKENHRTNLRSTLPRATKDQNLNYISTCQYPQLKKSNLNKTDFYNISKRTPRNEQQIDVMSKHESNYMNCNQMLTERITSDEGIKNTNKYSQNECFLSNRKSKYSLSVHLSKMGVDARLKTVTDLPELRYAIPDMCPAKTMEFVDGMARNCTGLFRDSNKNQESYGIKKSCKFGSETTDVLNLHSLSYIVFNISVQDEEYANSDTKISSENKSPFHTDLVIMPEKAKNEGDDSLNDIILGSKLKTQINRRLLRQETSIDEYNVFELISTIDMQKDITGERSDLQIYNLKKDNLKKKCHIYEAISRNREANNSAVRSVGNVVSKESALDLPLMESHLEINKEHRISNNTLKNNKLKNTKEKIMRNKKSKEDRNKFMKISNLFMSSYMTRIPFFQGLQTRVYSELRKSKLHTVK